MGVGGAIASNVIEEACRTGALRVEAGPVEAYSDLPNSRLDIARSSQWLRWAAMYLTEKLSDTKIAPGCSTFAAKTTFT